MIDLQQSLRTLREKFARSGSCRPVLNSMLEILPLPMAKSLSCSFAEHVVNSLVEVDDPIAVQSALEAIEAIRLFLDNHQKVGFVYEECQKAQSQDCHVSHSSGTLSLGHSATMVRLAKLCCCQRELEAERLTAYNRYQISIRDVADEAQRIAGEIAFDHDPKEAREQEAKWQFQKVVEAVECT